MGVLDDIFEGITKGVDGFLDDIGDAATRVLGEVYHNLITRVDDIFRDIFNKITNIPQALLEGLMKMFRDPKFWEGVLLMIGMVGFASGLSGAMDAAPGKRVEAFMKSAKMTYGDMHLDFITKAHKLAYIVSPSYRESYLRIMGEFTKDMYDAGVDAEVFGQIINDVGGLVEGFSALIGKDWDGYQESWAGQLAEIAEVSGEELQKWGKDPNALVDWLDDNIIREEHNKASAFISRLSTGLTTVTDTLEKARGDIEGIIDSTESLAKHVDKLYGTDYLSEVKEGTARFDTLILKRWEAFDKTLEDIAEVMTFNIEQERQNSARILIAQQMTGFEAHRRSMIETAELLSYSKGL